MIRQTYTLEIITPCFCAGADQSKAEIRAASIRGQLRWWFRVLGGFKSLAFQSVQEQETFIFGSAANDEGAAGILRLQIDATRLVSNKKDGQQLGHANFSDPAFLTFPIQSREKNRQKTSDASRGVIETGKFDLTVISRASASFALDIHALLVVFGNLGSLGFRARRAMGAVSLAEQSGMSFEKALSRLQNPANLLIKKLPAKSSKDAISVLGGWLKSCRAHGRSGQNQKEQKSPYFKYAQNDHDIGYSLPGTQPKAAYRAALGLPIIQKAGKGTNHWEWNWDREKARRNPQYKGEGRFASPVILRPHRDSSGNWNALVIFVDAHQWPADKDKQVYLNGQPRAVSLDLYAAMKADPRLRPFP